MLGGPEVADVRTRRIPPRACPVRVHLDLPHRLPGLFDRAGQLPRGARGDVAAYRRGRLSRPVPLLGEDLLHRVRDGRGVRPGHVLPVRHQLGRVLGSGGRGHRAADGLRGTDGLLPRSRVPRRHAVRHAEGRTPPALRSDLPGGCRNADLGHLDPVGELVDADPGRLHHCAGWPVPAGKLVGDRVQPELLRAAAAHGARIIPQRRVRRRCGRRLPHAALASARRRGTRQRRGTQDVFDGDVDGGIRGPRPDPDGRHPRAEHAALPAGEDRGDGG